METPFSQALNGLANVVANKWYAALGLAGTILFMISLLRPTTTDPRVAICIALMMMGWGFGQADCRTHTTTVHGNYKITAPAWQWTVTGTIMFIVAIGAAFRLAWLLLFAVDVPPSG